MAQEKNVLASVYVGNYDLALVVAADKKGNARFGWVDRIKKEARIGKKLFENLPHGSNAENEANLLAVMGGALTAKTAKREPMKVLLVMTDKTAPRYFEMAKAMKNTNSIEEVLQTLVKDWMPEHWAASLEDFVVAVSNAVEAGHELGAVKASELTFASFDGIELSEADPFAEEAGESVDELVAGDKLVIDHGAIKGKLVGDKVISLGEEARLVADKFTTGTFTVVDRGYDKRNGQHVAELCINRWENTDEDKIPALSANLMAVNRAVWDAMPKEERLEVTIEA